jgi:hypothetical protein
MHQVDMQAPGKQQRPRGQLGWMHKPRVTHGTRQTKAASVRTKELSVRAAARRRRSNHESRACDRPEM